VIKARVAAAETCGSYILE